MVSVSPVGHSTIGCVPNPLSSDPLFADPLVLPLNQPARIPKDFRQVSMIREIAVGYAAGHSK
jgi:hypothetical protein